MTEGNKGWIFHYEEPQGLVKVEPREAAEIICGRIPTGYTLPRPSDGDYFRDGKDVLTEFYRISFDANGMLRGAYVDHAIRSQVMHPLGIKIDPREMNTVIQYVGEIARSQEDEMPPISAWKRILKRMGTLS